MIIKKLITIVLISLLTANFAEANDDKCDNIQSAAKSETLNGQSNIPNNPYVTAIKNRVYFYTAPDSSCKQEDKFVIAGDFLYAYKIHGNFTYVNYLTSNGVEVIGWVNSAELESLNPISSKIHKKNINTSDFIVMSKDVWFGLGSSFSNSISLKKEKEVSSEYIGDFPNDVGGLNKFNSHAFKDFNVIVSNVNYNKRLWTIDDDYIISNITLTTPKYHTIRNIKVGDRKDEILKSYTGIKFNESSNKIKYSLNGMTLTFNLEGGVIISIEMSLIPEQD